MATRAVLTPGSAEPTNATFPEMTVVHTSEKRPALAFDAATDEIAAWTIVAPAGLTGTLTLVASYAMASATSGDVVLAVTVEAITDGDATDLDAATSYDTINTATASTVAGTAGQMKQVTITLTNADSMAAADLVRIRVQRTGSSGSDTATGDLLLLAAELRDAA